jgi:carbon storage regulator CsrA
MRIIVQSKGETVVINGDISVTVVDVLDEEVLLGIDAPEWVEVCESRAYDELESVPLHPR